MNINTKISKFNKNKKVSFFIKEHDCSGNFLVTINML